MIDDKDFLQCIPLILNLEGGAKLVNNPDDPGGVTKYGISKQSYPTLDIPTLSENQAKDIYYKDFWIAGKCHQIPDKRLKVAHFDASVNSGVGQAMKFLLRLPHDAFAFIGSGLYEDYIQERLNFYKYLAELNPRYRSFEKGWNNRIAHLQVWIKLTLS